ncbi:MAG: hypothetical protein M0R00_07250, partial [Candidatus Omnitrophica bacterium]|nr:hypothetical protein [Candidatus Omnitrophota bacterium]
KIAICNARKKSDMAPMSCSMRITGARLCRELSLAHRGSVADLHYISLIATGSIPHSPSRYVPKSWLTRAISAAEYGGNGCTSPAQHGTGGML